ncbi:MAG: branched-chain amino acid transporter AzlD [Clostridiaceae bacterium]|jgi:branched-subunit amino acid transport protein AzlD|nr:branched-chain amino acid transporter AzlD [Clostridiaceae bacterium]
MNLTEQIIIIALCAAATMLTRFLPFLIFSDKKATPKYITYLGKALPAASFAMLIVYSLRNTELSGGTYGLAEALAIMVTCVLYFWKRQMLLPIAGGTITYMLLVQLVF